MSIINHNGLRKANKCTILFKWLEYSTHWLYTTQNPSFSTRVSINGLHTQQSQKYTKSLSLFQIFIVRRVGFLDHGTSRMILFYRGDIRNNSFSIQYEFQLIWNAMYTRKLSEILIGTLFSPIYLKTQFLL